jgi:hypothetical protein
MGDTTLADDEIVRKIQLQGPRFLTGRRPPWFLQPERKQQPGETSKDRDRRLQLAEERGHRLDLEMGYPRARELESLLGSDASLDEKKAAWRNHKGWGWNFVSVIPPFMMEGRNLWPGFKLDSLPSMKWLKEQPGWIRYQRERIRAADRRKVRPFRDLRGPARERRAKAWLTRFLADLPEKLAIRGTTLRNAQVQAAKRLNYVAPEEARRCLGIAAALGVSLSVPAIPPRKLKQHKRVEDAKRLKAQRIRAAKKWLDSALEKLPNAYKKDVKGLVAKMNTRLKLLPPEVETHYVTIAERILAERATRDRAEDLARKNKKRVRQGLPGDPSTQTH